MVPTPELSGSERGLADQLEKLAQVLDAGVLTEEEFAAAKKQLLEQ